MNIVPTTQRNRKDHFVPQAYLRGFIDPARKNMPKPLWVFDVEAQAWYEKSPSEIAYVRGFYDYQRDSTPDETADETFAELERSFPQIRDDILARGFSAWPNHKEFLLKFGQMMRARSPLFREHSIEQTRKSRILTLTERIKIEPDPDKAGLYRQTWKVEAFTPKDEKEKNRLFKNKAITDMRSEIKKGADCFDNYDWCLQYTTDPTDPVIAADNCIVVDGKAPNLDAALTDPETLIFFPISWQMCLIGSPLTFDCETAEFHTEDLKRLRAIFKETAALFIVSPTQLSW